VKKTMLALLLPAVLCSCISTRPFLAVVNPDGSRTAISKQVVFLRSYDQAAAIDVAMDHGDFTQYTTSEVRRVPRAFGSSYFTQVTGTK